MPKQTKFNDGDCVKRKSDGAISEIKGISTKRVIWNPANYRPIESYSVDFGDGVKNYSPEELNYPTREEAELYNDAKKYNL